MGVISTVLCLLFATTALTLALPRHAKLAFNDPFIVGGEDVEVGEFPFQISLQIRALAFHICGGSIVDATHILTAAHCLDGQNPASLEVVAGAHNLTNEDEVSQQHIPVSRLIIHEDYDGFGFGVNDIGLIELASPIQFNDFVSPALLCTERPAANSEVINTGWGNANPQGQDNPTIVPDILQKVSLSAISVAECNAVYGIINNSHVCGTGEGINEGPSGACRGDSGGPLASRNAANDVCVTGVVSFGRIPCGFAPSVFMSVPNYVNWIQENIQ